MYANFQLEESAEGTDFSQVLYGYSSVESNLQCRSEDPLAFGPGVVIDVDLRLQPGWNVVSMFSDSENLIFFRSGAAHRPVEWRMYSDTF